MGAEKTVDGKVTALNEFTAEIGDKWFGCVTLFGCEWDGCTQVLLLDYTVMSGPERDGICREAFTNETEATERYTAIVKTLVADMAKFIGVM